MTVYKCFWELACHRDCHTYVCADTLHEAIDAFEKYEPDHRLQGVLEELSTVILPTDGIVASTNRFPS